MSRPSYPFLIFFFLLTEISFSQFDHSAKINFVGLASTDEKLPFSMYSNQRGRISEETNFSGWISGESSYKISDVVFFEAGVGLLFQDTENQILVDELYLKFQNSWLKGFIGRKQKPELYNGLSSTNESILWSLNARPIPGVEFSTSRPIFVLKEVGLGFEASLGEYFLEEDRFVRNARVHHKSFYLIYQPTNDLQIKAGLQHFVQWGGNSIARGEQPDDFSDYINVFLGQSGDKDAALGDQQNALGNNLGSYEIIIKKEFENFGLTLFYNSLFEDSSGLRWRNKIDGRYGLFFQDFEPRNWVNSWVYEFYYTKHQSQSTSGPHKFDNYFNNGVYRSGWTYEKHVIGSPFFITNFYSNDRFGNISIGNNSFIAHHLGIGGSAFGKFAYKLLSSYRRNYGHHRLYFEQYFPPDDPRGKYKIPDEILSTYLELNLLKEIIGLDLLLSADFTKEKTNLGIGVHLYKSF